VATASDPYAALGVPRDATVADIRTAYRTLAKASHPDVDSSPDAMAAMVRLNQAYALLADPVRRSSWDALHPPSRPVRHGHDGSSSSTQRGPGFAPPTHKAGRPPARPAPAPRPTPAASARPSANAGTTFTPPTLDEAFAFRMGPGKHQGRTLRAISEIEPDYLRWVVRSVNDRPRLVACARLVVEHLDTLTDGRPPTAAHRTGGPARPGAAAPRSAPPRTAPPAHTSGGRLGLPAATPERLVLVAVASLAALATFLGAWIVITLLGL